MLKSYWKFLSRNKLYSAVNVLGFAISLAFVLLLAIYVKQELSTDKFHSKKDRIYLLAETHEAANFANPVAPLLKEKFPEIEAFTRVVSREMSIQKDRENKIVSKALFADSSFFNIFDFKLIEGDPSLVLESKYSAVITKSFANNMFGNDDPIGKPIYINDTLSVTVKGVMEDFPKNTIFTKSDMVVNYQMIDMYWGTYSGNKTILETYDNSSFTTFLLAKEGSDLPARCDDILQLFKEIDYWLFTMGFYDSVVMIPLEDIYFSGVHLGMVDMRSNNKNLVSTYLIITILILVVAILNYINLSVSQASKRGKEAAMKKLLGSERSALMYQFIGESMIMTCISFVLGVIIALVAEPFFNDVLTTELNVLGEFSTLPFLLSVILAVLFIGVISGLIPAFTISSFKPIEVVKGSFTHKVKTLYSKILISFQYVVTIALLSSCVFIIQQSRFMRNYNLGFNEDHIVLIDNSVAPERENALRSLLEAIAGVEIVSFNQGTPFDGGNNSSFEYNDQSMSFQVFEVDSLFFKLYDIKISDQKNISAGENIVWVNRKGYNALISDPEHNSFEMWNRRYNVAGIIENLHIRSLHQEENLIMVFPKNEKAHAWSISVRLNPAADPVKTANEIKRVYAEFINDDLFEVEFGNTIIDQWYEGENKMSRVLIAFSILTLVILFMGILAMSLYFVQQKEKEIGIRKVNGATELEIIKMLNMNFIRSIILAFFISIPITYFAINRWLSSYPYKIDLQWWVFLVTGVFILILSVILITLQSYSAATKNPTEVLKSE